MACVAACSLADEPITGTGTSTRADSASSNAVVTTTDTAADPFRNGSLGATPAAPSGSQEGSAGAPTPALPVHDASMPLEPAAPTDVDAGGPVLPPPATPAGGAPLSLCSIDEGCQDGLLCEGAQPGFCTQACEESGDCDPLPGVELGCTEGRCRPRCDGGAECPLGFACDSDGNPLTRAYCEPVVEPGAGDRQALEPCDVLRGDSDCAAGLICYRWDDTRVDGPGYCTVACDGSEQCQLPNTGDAEIGCGSEGACRFTCGDAACPAFLECELVEGMGGRCHYPITTP